MRRALLLVTACPFARLRRRGGGRGGRRPRRPGPLDPVRGSRRDRRRGVVRRAAPRRAPRATRSRRFGSISSHLQSSPRDADGQAAGCYGRRVITVAAAETEANAHTLVHRVRPPRRRHARRRGSAGAERLEHVVARPRDRAPRRAPQRLPRRMSVSWDRNIAEIFAEDYTRLARPGAGTGSRGSRSRTSRCSPRSSTTSVSGLSPRFTTPPQQKPLVRVRSGRLAPRRSVAVPFGLLGPDRRVRATVEVAGAAASGVRARLELRCDDDADLDAHARQGDEGRQHRPTEPRPR